MKYLSDYPNMNKKEDIMIADKIKMLRNANNMTQTQLAKKLILRAAASTPGKWEYPFHRPPLS